MIQGGDPTGTGSGGSSYWGEDFRDEHALRNAYKHDARGLLSMANRGMITCQLVRYISLIQSNRTTYKFVTILLHIPSHASPEWQTHCIW